MSDEPSKEQIRESVRSLMGDAEDGLYDAFDGEPDFPEVGAAAGEVWVPCACCSLEVGLDTHFWENRHRDGRFFWCPNGHCNQYLHGQDGPAVYVRSMDTDNLLLLYQRLASVGLKLVGCTGLLLLVSTALAACLLKLWRVW